MIEIDFRINSLKKNKEKYDGKKIALYGIKDNAKRILEAFSDQNIVALLDEKSTGKYILGKLVISLEEAVILGIEVVIIAAEISSSIIVSKRILSFCRQNNITVLNMYGKNELDLQREILFSKSKYSTYSKEQLWKQIDKNEVICVQLTDVLCNLNAKSRKLFFELLEKRSNLENFAENRLQAEKMVSRAFSGLKDIYKCYETLVYPCEIDITELCNREEEFLIENMVPHSEMLDVVNVMISKGKKVCIISDLKISQQKVEILLNKLGIIGCTKIIQQNIEAKTFSNGALRCGMGSLFGHKTLYIGTEYDYNVVLAMSYDMEIALLKSPLEIMRDFSGRDICLENMSEQEIENHIQYVNKRINSPFVEDFDLRFGKKYILQKKNQWKMNEQLYEPIDTKNIGELPELIFPLAKQPKVSIIIPAYNQFSYTYNCLRSILKNTIGVEYEVILADDCSLDETKNIEQFVKNIKHIRNESNLLFLRNCNNAAKTANGEYILFLNNDTQVLFNWLAPMMRLMEEDLTVGMVGSKLIFPNGTLQEAGGIIWSDGQGANYGRGENPDLPEYCYVKEVDYLSGASIMIRKCLWQEIGGFDERFAPAYCEDSDLAMEVRRRGKKVMFQPASKVVHYEGISNGTDTNAGIKRFQIENQKKLQKKWHEILQEEHYLGVNDLFCARERKGKRKTVLFLSYALPKPDCDAGSVTVFNYLKLFLKRGYIVKFIASDFVNQKEYSFALEQMGIEVLCNEFYKQNLDEWVFANKKDIEIAFIHYPVCGDKFVELIKCAGIKIVYYGHDLHYLRKLREYELRKEEKDLQAAKAYYKMEKNMIEKADMVYYPSEEEVQIVKTEFGKDSVKAIPAYIFDKTKCGTVYEPEKRKGIMFIGGYNHSPNVDAVMWFTKEIYPQISPNGEIPFYIVGSHEPPELQNITAPGIIHKGYVTDNELAQLYSEIKMVVVPLRYGAGVKGKVIEAMYQGIPLVSTTVGIEGIQEAEEYITVADDATSFADKIRDFYFDDKYLYTASKNYEKLIEKYFLEDAVWNVIKEDFLV